MNKWMKLFLLVAVVLAPVVFYRYLYKAPCRAESSSAAVTDFRPEEERKSEKPQIALIFDDLGGSLQDIKDVHSLGIPLTVAVLPDLKFSKNISHIADRCGFSVLVHLPMEPQQDTPAFVKERDNFIRSNQPVREVDRLLRRYLNSSRVAVGVNNHMGSRATEDKKLMRLIMQRLKEKGMVFIDSHTSERSCCCEVASQVKVLCAENSGFLDSVDELSAVNDKISRLAGLAETRGKIVVIAHPKHNTFSALRRRLPALKNKIEFITIKEYFGL